MATMKKLNLHIASVPNIVAQTEIVKMITASNRKISRQTALDMVKNPPLLLLRDLTPEAADECKDKMEKLGVGFWFSDSESADQSPPPDDGLKEFADIKAHNRDADRDAKVKPASVQAVGARNTAGAVSSADAEDLAGAVNETLKPATPKQNITPKPAQAAFSASSAPKPKSTHTANLFQNTGLGSSPGSGGGYQQLRGVRIEGLDRFEAMRLQELKAKRTSTVFSIVSALVVTAVALVLVVIPKDCGTKPAAASNSPSKKAAPAAQAAEQASSKQANQPATSTAEPNQQAAVPDQQTATAQTGNETKEEQRGSVSSLDKQQANDYIDSARATGANRDRSIKFYRIAISLNRYNLSAWQGLLQAYRDQNMTKEAQETNAQMQEIFGDRVASVSNLVRAFGDISDTYTNEKGTYRVEYRTNKRKRNEILNEVFTMTRSVRTACACQDISIFASTAPGKGMLVHSTPETSVHSLTAFRHHAQIVWTE
ncbi:MAG: hypothetical protein FWC23_03485 [Chitinispirillia bacterium]|nr:hypothetical protein [Chitinispirillia bacterium]MCL2268237.1 hypothetical protein [Chitinispirillia bacterium]